MLETEKREEDQSKNMDSKRMMMIRKPWYTRVSETCVNFENRQKEISRDPFSKVLNLAFII